MRKATALLKAQLASNQASYWSKITINGQVMLPQQMGSWSYGYPRGDHGATGEIILTNERGQFTDYFKYGQIVQMEEGLVEPGGVVRTFGGFYGEIAVISPQELGSSKLKISCVDYVGKLSGLDIDTQIESPKTRVISEGLTPTYLPAPNDNLAQVFSFANTALATRPPVLVYIYDKGTNFKFLQESGYEIDSANGLISFGRPINMTNFNVTVDYSYYPSATALYVEDVMEQIITAVDGYGNTPFNTTDHLLERLSHVDEVAVDTMLPNVNPTTIDGVTYGRFQCWYTSYNNIQGTLAAGDFTVPGGATIDLISERFGRIILDQSLTEDAVVTCDVDYQFNCLQSSGIQINYLSVRGKQVANRWEALKAAKAVLAPNYALGTKQTSPGKVWARYMQQNIVSDADLDLVLSEDINKDSDVYTRVLLYGRNINPTDLCMGTDVNFVLPSTFLKLDTDIWEAVAWTSQGSPSSTPAIVRGRVEIEEGDALQSKTSLQRGTWRTRLRAGANYSWSAGFIDATDLGAASPKGVYFESEGYHTSAPARPGAPTIARGYVWCVTSDGSGTTKTKAQFAVTRDTSTGLPSILPGRLDSATVESIVESIDQDIDLIIEWTASKAIFYVNGMNAGEITTNLPDPTSKICYIAGAGQLSVENCVANGGSGGEVHDEFITQDYIGTAYRQPMRYVESGDGYRRYYTGIIGGSILGFPVPLFYVNGIALVSGLHQVTDAPVQVVETAYTYDRSSGGIGSNSRIDTDWSYRVLFSHRSLSPMYPITIYDYLGNVWTTIAANTPASVLAGWNGTELNVVTGNLTPIVMFFFDVLNRIDYPRGIYYVHPRDVGLRRSEWDFSRHIRHGEYFFEGQGQFSLRSADYYVEYSDDVIEIDYENGLVSIREGAFANETTRDEPPSDIVEGTFYYQETYGTMLNAYNLLDGNMSTSAQMAFKAAPVPGHHLFTVDLQSDQRIDAIDISGGFYIPPGEDGSNRKLAVSMNLSLYTSSDGMTFSLPAKEAYNFALSSGDVVTFDHEQLGDGFTARYLQLRVEQVENVTFGSLTGIWPVVIQQFRAFQDVIVKGEAKLVTDSADVTSTTLEDVDGLLAALGDRVFKNTDSNQFFGSKSTLDRVAKGFLQEFYKNHSRMKAEVAVGPHLEQGATVSVTDPSNKITRERYFVESIRCRNGRRTLELARYP